MNYVLSYFTNTQVSNYTIMNETNVFNSLIQIFELLKEVDKVKFIEILTFQCGKSFIETFKNYVFRKSPKHEILDYM
jgi:hypothetical protein